MALVECKECGTQVSTKADACPKCGAVRNRKPGFLARSFIGLGKIIGGIVGGLVGLFVAIWFLSGGKTITPLQELNGTSRPTADTPRKLPEQNTRTETNTGGAQFQNGQSEQRIAINKEAITQSEFVRDNPDSLIALDEDGTEEIAINIERRLLTIYQTKKSAKSYLKALYEEDDLQNPDPRRLKVSVNKQNLKVISTIMFSEKLGEDILFGTVIELPDKETSKQIWCGLRKSERMPYTVEILGAKYWAADTARKLIRIPRWEKTVCPPNDTQ